VNSPISSACSPSENVSIQSSAGFEHSGPLSPFSQPQITNSERRRCATLNDLDLDEAEFTPGLKKRKSSLLVDLEAASLTSKKKHRGQVSNFEVGDLLLSTFFISNLRFM